MVCLMRAQIGRIVLPSTLALPVHIALVFFRVSASVKREAVIAGLASEGLALLLGSAEAGSSAVVRPTPTDPVEFRKCARDLKAMNAAKEYTNEENLCFFFIFIK